MIQKRLICTLLTLTPTVLAGRLADSSRVDEQPIASTQDQTIEGPVRAPPDPGVITTRQAITPAGFQTVFDGRVYAVTFGDPSSEIWVLTATNAVRLDYRANKVMERVAVPVRPGLQGIHFDAVAKRPLVTNSATTGRPDTPLIARLLAIDSGKVRVRRAVFAPLSVDVEDEDPR